MMTENETERLTEEKEENTSVRTKISGEHNRRSTILLPHEESDDEK